MQLEAGTRLGHYEVLSSLGAGGMGEVYRAKDTKLGREVAIKLLLDEVSSDPERLARFDREARVLASLNHPNIASLHAFEQDDDTNFLVMELVEGETLAERISRGPERGRSGAVARVYRAVSADSYGGADRGDGVLRPCECRMSTRAAGAESEATR